MALELSLLPTLMLWQQGWHHKQFSDPWCYPGTELWWICSVGWYLYNKKILDYTVWQIIAEKWSGDLPQDLGLENKTVHAAYEPNMHIMYLHTVSMCNFSYMIHSFDCTLHTRNNANKSRWLYELNRCVVKCCFLYISKTMNWST